MSYAVPATIAKAITISNTTDATTKDTGCLILEGGIGVEKAVFAGTTITATGKINTDSTVDASTTADGSLQTDGGLSVTKDAVIGDDLMLLSDAAVLNFGADKDVTLTHVADTGLLLNAAMQLQLRDSAIHLASLTDGHMDATADVSVDINSPLLVTSGRITVDDTTDAASTTDGSLQTDGGLSVVKDAVVGDDLLLLSDGAVLNFGADKDVNLTHVADTGLLLNAAMQIQLRDSAIHIASAADGHLDLTADTSIDLNGLVACTENLELASGKAYKINAQQVVGARGNALTAQLTAITHTAPSTPDYAIQNFCSAGGVMWVTADEANTVLSVIANLQTRVQELENRLKATGGHGLIADPA